MRLFILEDNEDNALLLELYLKEKYELVFRKSPLQALQDIPQILPDLLIVDISLPEIDGVEFLKRVREIPEVSHTPAIALTAYASKEDKKKFLQKGFDAHVSKPLVNKQTLIDTIEAFRSKTV